MGTATQGLFGGEPEVADRARMIAAIPEVTGELIGIGMGLGAVRLLEFHANDPMEARAAARRHTSIHHLTIQSVNETKTRREASAWPLEHACVPDECPLAGESRAPQFRIVFRPAEAGSENAGHELTPGDTGSFQKQSVLPD